MDRILTTHAGSLARPRALLDFLVAMEHGEPVDASAYEQTLVDAVGDVVRRQVDAGIDVVDDGEMGKPNWIAYLYERVSGIEPRFVPAEGGTILPPSRDRQAFPEFYAEHDAEFARQVANQVRVIRPRMRRQRSPASSTRRASSGSAPGRSSTTSLRSSGTSVTSRPRSRMSMWSTRSSRWWRLRASTG